MCGRYVSASSPGEIADYFGAAVVTESLTEANYNVAPTAQVPVVHVSNDARTLGLFRWGLLPFWAKSASMGAKMINARVETVTEKSAFKSSVQKRRCIIPADAYYEWTSVPNPAAKKPLKQPWCIQRSDDALFSFAGIYSTWRDPEGDGTKITTCSILTGPASQRMQEIHDRMPIMIPPNRWDDWLDPTNEDAATLLESIPAPPDELFAIHAVSTAVNNSRSSGAQLLDEVEPITAESLAAAAQGQLEMGSA